MAVAVQIPIRLSGINREMLEIILEWLAPRLLPKRELSLELTVINAGAISRINRQFLAHPGPTDVITFNYSPLPSKLKRQTRNAPPSPLQGEILVCLDEAIRQAILFQSSPAEELLRYCIHGMLHLAGLDDATASGRRQMKRAEDRWLRAVCRQFSVESLFRTPKRRRKPQAISWKSGQKD